MGFVNWLKHLFGGSATGPEHQLEGEVDPRLSMTPEELVKEIDGLKAELTKSGETIAALKLAYADKLNDAKAFQKRLMKEQERAVGEAKSKVMRELLDVSDEFQRAVAAIPADATESPFAKGLFMVKQSLDCRLKSQGVEKMDLLNKPFDPNMAEALARIEVDSKEKDGLILEVHREGYTINGSVLRDARVTIGYWPAPEPEPVPEPAASAEGEAPAESSATPESGSESEAATPAESVADPASDPAAQAGCASDAGAGEPEGQQGQTENEGGASAQQAAAPAPQADASETETAAPAADAASQAPAPAVQSAESDQMADSTKAGQQA